MNIGIETYGTIKPYYIQTLAMTYFPGAKFPELEHIFQADLRIFVEVIKRDGEIMANAALIHGSEGYRWTETIKIDSVHGDLDRAKKVAAGKAFVKAAERMTGIVPPWGILTGVRPAKVATELLERGFSPDEVAAIISSDYSVSPIKARLATDVAVAEGKVITPQSRRECSVYIGIPFCPTRCAYCSFVSYTSPKLLSLIPDYLDALENDIDGIFSVIRDLGMKVSTVYIGGGTPTILDASQLDRLLSRVNSHTDGLTEFTLEAGRPDTITEDKLKVAATHDVDRISVNTQTLNDEVLRKIGRAHDTRMFFEAYETAKKIGIKNINVDLIAGLPYDTTDSFKDTVDRVIGLDPENITVHTFSVKRSSEFKTEGRFDADSRTAADSVDYSQKALTESGYLPYYMYRQKNTVGNLENVGYAKPGHEGLYNIYMMEEVHTVFAAGASSVTKLVSVPDADGNVRIERLFQPKYPYEYLDNHRGEAAGEKLDIMRKAAREFFDK